MCARVHTRVYKCGCVCVCACVFIEEVVRACSVLSDCFVTPWTVARQAPLSWSSPGKKTGVGCHFLLQEIFLTQGSNPSHLCLLNWHKNGGTEGGLERPQRGVCKFPALPGAGLDVSTSKPLCLGCAQPITLSPGRGVERSQGGLLIP